MPSVNDATNWHQRLIALKGLVSKVIVVVSKDNAPLITTNGKNNEKVVKMPPTPIINTKSAPSSTFKRNSPLAGNMLDSNICEEHAMGFLTLP
jgi:hypothetical protein